MPGDSHLPDAQVIYRQPQMKVGGIEILSVESLDKHRALVESLKSFTRSLGLELGWHYLLDLTWIISHLGEISGQRILDAGAGTGVLQWYLAELGATVFSVDRMSRADLPLRFRRRFHVQGVRRIDLNPDAQAFLAGFHKATDGALPRRWLGRLVSQCRELAGYLFPRHTSGCVKIYNQDLSNLVALHTDSFDAVVAVSALEHNSPAGLQQVISELLRVLKPGGLLLATLVAGREQDTWHEPSSAWCYTDQSLRRLFDLPAGTPSNYSQYDQLIAELRDCAELRDGLAKFYFKSGQTGMPWGKWDPQYQPVGVCKIKPLRPLTT